MGFFFLFLTLVLWAYFDFWLGRRMHVRGLQRRTMPLRQSDFQTFTDGSLLYKQLFHDIKQATHHIHILFFIVKNDEISSSFLQLLQQKAEQGVEVRLLLDRIGSNRLSSNSIRHMRESGVHFSFCHLIKPPFLFYSMNERNHRKLAILDGKIGYIGGFNIGEEYLGHDRNLGKWRDYHLRLVGEGVCDLQEQFLHDWRDETKENLIQNKTYYPEIKKGNICHRFIPTDGAFLQTTFLELIEQAKHEIFIGTPYFIPGTKLQKSLLLAAKRGVHITILVPEKADHPFVREARLRYLRGLHHAGCKLYQYTNGFYHAKIVLIDHSICDIGTANFDLRSLFLNHEMNCLIYDPAFITSIKEKCKQDLQHSRLISEKDLHSLPFHLKWKEWIATLISPFL
ncbi:cardiolipin synthase [Ectobacillus sp. sgz5001026]|uniref:cardiolipin synthase n=1 Tax=Ectobacillus sp. sgz5001026 TaxID=3242473 RepID=UPI0036D3C80D